MTLLELYMCNESWSGDTRLHLETVCKPESYVQGLARNLLGTYGFREVMAFTPNVVYLKYEPEEITRLIRERDRHEQEAQKADQEGRYQDAVNHSTTLHVINERLKGYGIK